MTIYLPDDHFGIKLLNDKGFQNVKPASHAPENETIAELAIQNFMPKRMEAEVQIARMLAASHHNIRITCFAPTDAIERAHLTVQKQDAIINSGDPKQYDKLRDAHHIIKNMSPLQDIQNANKPWAGIWATGYARPQTPFEDVAFMADFKSNLTWANKQPHTMLINVCWASHVALDHFYGIERQRRESKLTGQFEQSVYDDRTTLLKGLREDFYLQVSRSYGSNEQQLKANTDLIPLAGSDETGTSIAINKEGNQAYFTAHPEYDPATLVLEAMRDLDALGDAAPTPKNINIESVGRKSQKAHTAIGRALGEIFQKNASDALKGIPANNNEQEHAMVYHRPIWAMPQ